MNIENKRPPNFEAILEAFPGADKPGVCFAWEDTIYNPSGVRLPADILAHEMAHGSRQFSYVDGGVQGWWDKYLVDHEFRYDEELAGHAAELISRARAMRWDKNRIAQLFNRTAIRLIAPLYNYQPRKSLRQAVLDLRRVVGA